MHFEQYQETVSGFACSAAGYVLARVVASALSDDDQQQHYLWRPMVW